MASIAADDIALPVRDRRELESTLAGVSRMTSFADSWELQELLRISKQHRDAVDSSRVFEGIVVGTDNWSTLRVSTVFAAISIEAALNDYILSHCLFVETPYLQSAFGEITKHYLRASVRDKIEFLTENWPDDFPAQLLTNVRRLFDIRNLITHRRGRFTPAKDSDDGKSRMSNRSITREDLWHMLDHYEIAHDF